MRKVLEKQNDQKKSGKEQRLFSERLAILLEMFWLKNDGILQKNQEKRIVMTWRHWLKG